MTERLFVSVDLPPELAEEVASLQSRFEDAAGLDFTDPAQAHVTMKFLGDVEAADIDPLAWAVADAVAEADVEPFEAEIGGLGVFPSPDYISVLWTGVREGSRELTALHEAIETATVDLGFDPADHEFTPHVTLARMRDGRGKELIQDALDEADPTVGRFEVEEVRLTQSTLTEEGPVYETLDRFLL